MPKKLTITVDTEVYDGLQTVIGRRRISRFLSDLARPHVVAKDRATAYAAMAADKPREREATAWTEALPTDMADEPAQQPNPPRHQRQTPSNAALSPPTVGHGLRCPLQ
jgi:hypothetical protein